MADAIEVPGAVVANGRPASGGEPDLTGKTLGDFRVLRRLGQGGMGRVYLAEQNSLKRKVALKVLRPELAANEISLKRFKMEAETVARATHANIVQVYTISESDGVHYMVLEYVEGRNLREYLEKKGPPEILFGLSIMRQVAAALQRAGELGVVHRDIKPENILLTRKGEAKVADFGLSRIFDDTNPGLNLTQTGVAMGTPLYMSPEQIEGSKTLDPRTDIYSFGVMCYHMFAGHPPFRGQSPYEVALQHVQKEAEPLGKIRPDLPAELCALIHKMMAKKPADRCQTAREIGREASRLRDTLVTASVLSQATSQIMPGAPAPVQTEQDWSFAKPRRWSVLAGIGVLAVAALVGFFAGWRAPPAKATAATPESGTLESENVLKASTTMSPQEAELLKLVREYMRPGNNLDTAAGLKHAMELTVFYLEDLRLSDAEKFFAELDRNERVRAYRTLSQLGRACVLAFRNQPAESNKIFVALTEKAEKKLGPLNDFWKNDPPMREVVARALFYNFQNDPEHFPRRQLDAYRQPPTPTIAN